MAGGQTLSSVAQNNEYGTAGNRLLMPRGSSATLRTRANRHYFACTAVLVPLLLAGCASFMASTTSRMAGDLAQAIRNQDDPPTVRDGAPAYLLLTDSLIEGDPKNTSLLLTGARLYSSYGTIFVDDPARAQRLTARARVLADRALCFDKGINCDGKIAAFDDFRAVVEHSGRDDVPLLYAYGSVLASWIQTRQDDWAAVALIPYVRVTMERVVMLDEQYDHGGANLYLGFIYTMLPPTLGGKPEEGRRHFERAIALSHGKSLMPKVMLAERYARMAMNRELHDRLLQEVIDADPHAPDLTLMNALAQEQARALQASAEQYF